ncbi:hypothetical protein [Lysinibacillus yapensis]|uniref:hypothetical protein n=1 Tax=Ureibacillus yapensis TaxID=2304605 RepID=UPI0018F37DCB|nr:hypothetical protein [Lysinibacillus yapensis]
MNDKKREDSSREEYAHGFDLNPDDFDTIDHRAEAKKQNKNQDKADINQPLKH